MRHPRPACGERVGVRGRLRLPELTGVICDAALRSQRSESRRGPLTLASLDFSPHAGRGKKNLALATRSAPEFCPPPRISRGVRSIRPSFRAPRGVYYRAGHFGPDAVARLWNEQPPIAGLQRKMLAVLDSKRCGRSSGAVDPSVTPSGGGAPLVPQAQATGIRADLCRGSEAAQKSMGSRRKQRPRS